MLVALAAGQAWAAEEPYPGVSVRVDQLYHNSRGGRTALVTVVNRREDPIARVHVACSFLRKGKPYATGEREFRNVPAGGSASDQVLSGRTGPSDTVECRIDQLR